MLYPLSYEGGGRETQHAESSVWPQRSHCGQSSVENCRRELSVDKRCSPGQNGCRV